MAAATGGGEAPPPPLHPIEAQRAIAVLEDAREKLLFLSRITPGISEHKQELSQAVGDEIQKLMAEQQELEARFEALTRARQEAEVRRMKRTHDLHAEHTPPPRRRCRSRQIEQRRKKSQRSSSPCHTRCGRAPNTLHAV